MFEHWNEIDEYNKLSKEEKLLFDLKRLDEHVYSNTSGEIEQIDSKLNYLVRLIEKYFTP